jgi:hypothetical protein
MGATPCASKSNLNMMNIYEQECTLRQVGVFFPGTPVSSTNKTDRHDITEILLKVALNV